MKQFWKWAIPFNKHTPPIEEQFMGLTPQDSISAIRPHRTNYFLLGTNYLSSMGYTCT